MDREDPKSGPGRGRGDNDDRVGDDGLEPWLIYPTASQLVLDVLSSSSDEEELAACLPPRFGSLDGMASPSMCAINLRGKCLTDKQPSPSHSSEKENRTPQPASRAPTSDEPVVTPMGVSQVPVAPKTTRAPVCRVARIVYSSGRGHVPRFLDCSSSEEEDEANTDAPVETDQDAWFLESLSEAVEPRQSEPDALLFRKSFGALRDKLVTKLFTIFNRELFQDRLPEVEVVWRGCLTSTAGRCCLLGGPSYRVELSDVLLTSAERTRDTLLHELCHAAAWCVQRSGNGHGHAWRFWTDRAKHRFPKLPIVLTCHNYKTKLRATQRALFV